MLDSIFGLDSIWLVLVLTLQVIVDRTKTGTWRVS